MNPRNIWLPTSQTYIATDPLPTSDIFSMSLATSWLRFGHSPATPLLSSYADQMKPGQFYLLFLSSQFRLLYQDVLRGERSEREVDFCYLAAKGPHKSGGPIHCRHLRGNETPLLPSAFIVLLFTRVQRRWGLMIFPREENPLIGWLLLIRIRKSGGVRNR